MPGFMTATAKRDLLRRAMLPRPSHATPELNAALIAATQEEIDAARHYAEAMLEQRNHALAGHGFVEARRLERHKAWLEGKREGGDDVTP